MEHPFIIDLQELSGLSKTQRRRIRINIIQHIKDLKIDELISEKNIDAMAAAIGSHPEFVLTPSLDKDGRMVVSARSRARLEEEKRSDNLKRMSKIRRRLAMRREGSRCPSWQTYFKLSERWPDKLKTIMPLDDPDDVAIKKPMYESTLTAMRSMSMDTKSPYFNIWAQYIESCF